MKIATFLVKLFLALMLMLSPFIFMFMGAASLIYLQYLLYRGMYAESPALGDNYFCHIAAILGSIGIGLGLWLWNRIGERVGLFNKHH